MASDKFILDFSDFNLPPTKDNLLNYLDNKAKILSNYINIQYPLKFIPEETVVTGSYTTPKQEVIEEKTTISKHYILNFTIPISIIYPVLNNNKDINDLRYIIQEKPIKKYEYIHKININEYEDLGIFFGTNLKAPFFILKLVKYILEKININLEKKIKSIFDSRLYDNAKKKYTQIKLEKERQYELERPEIEKRKQEELRLWMEQYEKTKKCNAYIKTANDKIDTLNKKIAKYKQVAIEQEQLFKELEQTYPIIIEEQQQLETNYMKECTQKGGGKYKRTAKKRKIRKSTSKRR